MKKICNFCGSDRYEERRIEYLYSHEGKYLIVFNTPVEVCLNCGMVYYDATVLKEIERRFFAIYSKAEKPDRYLEVPAKEFV
ncbi:MAG: type II toxin-antitoxin system MqsA family antitoxin [Candidatus Edwardsbacteria bacterium]